MTNILLTIEATLLAIKTIHLEINNGRTLDSLKWRLA